MTEKGFFGLRARKAEEKRDRMSRKSMKPFGELNLGGTVGCNGFCFRRRGEYRLGEARFERLAVEESATRRARV